MPSILLALVNMILEGPSIHDNNEASTSAALSIAQLLKFNSINHKRKQATPTIRHSIDQETPVPIYIGLILHAHSCKMDLVDRLYSLGMSISYDRVLCLTALISAAVDNADYKFSLLQLLIMQITTPPQHHRRILFMALPFPSISIRAGVDCSMLKHQ